MLPVGSAGLGIFETLERLRLGTARPLHRSKTWLNAQHFVDSSDTALGIGFAEQYRGHTLAEIQGIHLFGRCSGLVM